MLEEIKNIKSGKKELREFGFVIGAALLVLGGVALWRGKGAAPYMLGAGLLFVGLGLAVPAVLKPLQKAWMALGLVLGFFVSRIVLAILFYGVMTPIGFLMRICGKDVLELRIDRDRASYWQIRTASAGSKENYLNQY